MEQQPLDSNGGIIDVLFPLHPHLVAHLAAVTVDSVADAIKEPAFLALNLHHRQIFQIIVEQDHSVHGILTNIVPEIIAGTCRKII